MSSYIDKKYGDMFIFGKYHDTEYVDLVWSSHGGEFTIEHITQEEADNLRRVWNDLKDYALEFLESEFLGDNGDQPK